MTISTNEATRSFYLESLGCSKNQVDSEVMLGTLFQAGYTLIDDPQAAEIIIVNTCAFIEEATRESIETILALAEEKKTGACRFLVVCGCLSQRYRDELLDELPEVDLFVGTGEYPAIGTHLERLFTGQAPSRLFTGRPSFLMDAETPRILTAPGSSAYLKIAEGCSHRCTYCTIPSIRGPYQQRQPESIIREAQKLSDAGIREINLVAQDTTRYEGLADLLKKLARIDGLHWIRLLYGHPLNLGPDVIALLAAEEKLCSYIDVPLQHIADPVLKRMGRRITRARTEQLIADLQKNNIAIRTTFIVGFPGETEQDFSELLSFVQSAHFEHLGTFAYRDEEGTPAARMGTKVPEEIKQERYDRLMTLQAGIAAEKNRARIGNSYEVLVDGISADETYALYARTAFQAPEVDGVVLLNEALTIGEFTHVTVTAADTYDLIGKTCQ